MHKIRVLKGVKKTATGGRLVGQGLAVFVLITLMFVFNLGYADGWLPNTSNNATDDTTSANNQIQNNTLSSDGLRIGGIANTRHNLTMSYNGQSNIMDEYRNNYYEICVYCHTPHGANSTADAPLWNRTVTQRTYTLYNQDQTTGTNVFREPSALDLSYTQPGPNSLTCLSCHDGATAIDSVINMPTQLNGAFRAGYSKGQETNVNTTFLDAWSGNKLGMPSPADNGTAGSGHAGFNSDSSFCISCHNPTTTGIFNAPDFRVLVIGDQYSARDDTTGQLARKSNYLADDHPIGVEYPKEFGDNVDYNEPDVKLGKIAFFDLNGNRHADPNEVRLYDTGDGYEVECGSCHDPHGIKVTGDSNELIPSFLRVGEIRSDVANADTSSGGQAFVASNTGSSLCLTCHVK